MFSIQMRGNDKFEKLLDDAKHGAKSIAVPAYTEYMIGDGRHGLKHYPAYRHVTRRRAYGKPFFSDRQRRKVMAIIRNKPPGYPHRTGRLQRGWYTTGEPYRLRIHNREKYAAYVHGDETQSRHEKLVGWRTIAEIVDSNERGALREAQRAVDNWLDGLQK